MTSGLGRVYPVSFLDLPSYVDGIAEYVPGITPYRWNYGMPAKAVEMVYGGDKELATKWSSSSHVVFVSCSSQAQ